MQSISCRAVGAALVLVIAGCQMAPPAPPAPSTSDVTPQPSSEYVIGPGDKLNIFVWRNPDLSANVPVRPDGRVSIPLVEDVVAVGKTSTGLARDIEEQLKKYVKEPVVTVIGEAFVGPFTRQVRIIGEAATPRAIAYRANMTVLDAMIEVGGLTKYAAGNDTVLVRVVNGTQATYSVRLNSLIKDGDVSANVALDPGDILIIPQRLL
jgi:polysaccharide export outer membrane protein